MSIRETVIQEMKRQGLTQYRLAELAGISQPRVNDYVRGRRDMRGESLDKVFRALGLTLVATDLANDEDQP